MGIIIILVILVSALIFIAVIGINRYDWEFLGFLTILVAVLIGIAAISCSIFCICTQASKEVKIYQLSQERESLVESYNIYNNNYEKDVAHFQSLKEIRYDIANFNAKINENNRFSKNFFVNWFYVDCNDIEQITITNGTAN